MQLDAHLAVVRGRRPAEHPGEHKRNARTLAFLTFTLHAILAEELSDLQVELVQVFINVVLPEIKVGDLPRDVHRIVEAQPVDNVLVWLVDLGRVGTDQVFKAFKL